MSAYGGPKGAIRRRKKLVRPFFTAIGASAVVFLLNLPVARRNQEDTSAAGHRGLVLRGEQRFTESLHFYVEKP